MKSNKFSDAKHFADVLKKIDLGNKLKIGKFELRGNSGVKNSIQYNRFNTDMLDNKHEYSFPLLMGDLQVSLQLYKNSNNHYRLFCYSYFNGKQGLLFSMNLTTEKESEEVVFLTQNLKFAEHYVGSQELAKAHRRQKQIVFCNLLSKLGWDVIQQQLDFRNL